MGAETPLNVGRRRDSRLRLSVPGQLITLTGTHKVNLRDVSQSGAKLVVPEEIKNGEDGVLVWLEYEAFGTIVWMENGFAGMAFDEPLPATVLLATRKKFDHRAYKTHEQEAREQAADWYLGYKNR
ncbi:PilZ domain-containing protein [Aurantiacibacter suaedae]|uniref:PilZ domain-containing protein n=1 Tax=Aurantiacibacter suaedae TaxID=2545755 RepID=UPI0010FA56CF|nr:PilZ domain-containing protein [Aurantiacibacter suaedae]